ncbi:hypothetical protein [Flammeovirga sp. OC4]|uniref:hypothetical protein n=1 Tax=Flammeovirga sp. OC4 TaxID=1382345 RepID=UPI0005C5FE02|nr:hypothetical protein [Flammeovirga sp. OC4]
MKTIRIFMPLILMLFLFIRCQGFLEEQENEFQDEDNQQLGHSGARAKEWFNTFTKGEPAYMKTQTGEKIYVEPIWKRAYSVQKTELLKVIDVPVNSDRKLHFFSSEAKARRETSNDPRFTFSMTRLVVTQNRQNGNIFPFFMTVAYTPDYMERKGFNVYKDRFLEKQFDLDANVYYHNLSGELIDGYIYQNGRVTGRIFPDQYSISSTNARTSKVNELGCYDVPIYKEVTNLFCTDVYVEDELISHHCEVESISMEIVDYVRVCDIVEEEDVLPGGGTGSNNPDNVVPVSYAEPCKQATNITNTIYSEQDDWYMADFDLAVMRLKEKWTEENQSGNPKEWGMIVYTELVDDGYGGKARKLNPMADPIEDDVITEGFSNQAWEGLILKDLFYGIPLGNIHTHPMGTNNPPSATDIYSLFKIYKTSHELYMKKKNK